VAASSNRGLDAIGSAPQWLNSEPLTAAELKGKVVLVSFWTYSCVNWIRTQPYLRAWAEKYEDDGLVVIGVHTPEFEFEKNLENVRWAVGNLGVGYPVVTDNDLGIWRAFGNQYWPAFYFIDASGRLRHEKFGEGDYEQSERVIQQLLIEAGAKVDLEPAAVTPVGLEVAADWGNLKTPETYVGYARASGFASPGGMRVGEARDYVAPSSLRTNQWGLSGNWLVEHEAATVSAPGGRIVFKFRARDVNLVMGPSAPGSPVRFRVLVDGEAPGAAHGGDVDANGYGTVVEQRLYQLVRQPGDITDREVQIEFLDAGAEAYAFTFG
jgi:thiol-disulfide isomerase/thioredoxin